MGLETKLTPAELLAADGTTATAAVDEAPSYDPTTTTLHSLMQELPPRPPSPYRTMHLTARHTTPGKSSVTSSFLRGRRNPHSMAAVAATSDDVATQSQQHGLSLTESAKSNITSDKGSLIGLPPAPNSLVYKPTQSGDSAMVYVDPETHDSAMRRYLFYEAPRQRLVEVEENERNALLAHEEVVFTSTTISALQARAELLAGNEAAELVVAAALERAEARCEMLQVIEVEVAARLREQRLGEMLELQFRALLPAHEAGYHRIEEDEREDLRRLFLWHKEHRPLGPGCFIRGPEKDYRLKYASRGTSAATAATSSGSRSLVVGGNHQRSALSSAMSSRDYAAQLRRKNFALTTPNGALGELALLPLSDGEASQTMSSTQDGTFGPGEEAVFVEEGRLRLQEQKNRRHEELRERRRFTELIDAQADARQYVLAEEALMWMHLARAAVDDLYAAVEATRLRKHADAADAAMKAEREAQRNALKEQMMRDLGLTKDCPENSNIPHIEYGNGEVDVGLLSPTEAEASSHNPKGSKERPSERMRKISDSTVVDSAATDASLDPLLAMNVYGGVEYRNDSDVPLTHLRLIAEETEESAMCRQLAHCTSSEVIMKDCN